MAEQDGSGDRLEGPSRKEQLEAVLKRAVLLASEDPDAFLTELKAIGRRFGMTVEEVYAKAQQDPEFARYAGREAVRKAIQEGAKKLRERFGL